MYITYESTCQRPAVEVDPKKYGLGEDTGDPFRPTWLIRASDWQKVPGEEAIEGYCTLSYCWEQSGSFAQAEDGKRVYTDKAKHKMRTAVKRSSAWCCFWLRNQDQVLHVTYEEILRRVCKDFGIKYLWYDKICINQSDKVEKQNEIRQMHRIYNNAQFTVVMLPEAEVTNEADFENPDYDGITKAHRQFLRSVSSSRWWERSWTLEEVMMSKSLLLVGRNMHLWQFPEKAGDRSVARRRGILTQILDFDNKPNRSVSQVLGYARSRTATTPHDIIFSMANILHVNVDVDYEHDICDLFNDFYRKLAENDLSMLCFGQQLGNGTEGCAYLDSVPGLGLPSWTGIGGRHALHEIGVTTMFDSPHYVDEEMRMHLSCKYYSVRRITRLTPIKDTDASRRLDAILSTIYPNGGTKIKLQEYRYDENVLLGILNRAMKVESSSSFDITHYHRKPAGNSFFPSDVGLMPFSLTEDCDECIILPIIFDLHVPIYFPWARGDESHEQHHHVYYLPVISAVPEGHKIIGLCRFLGAYPPADITRKQDPFKLLQDAFGSQETKEFVIV